MFINIKAMIKKRNEIYIIIMHDFNNIPRAIQTNHSQFNMLFAKENCSWVTLPTHEDK